MDKMDARYLPKKFTKEFLDLYKSLECLWKVKCKAYTDKAKKAQAYQILVDKMREVDPEATRDSVIRKINSFRSCFRKEAKKVERSMMTAACPEEVYKPQLWYYDLLMFTKDQDPWGNRDTSVNGEPEYEDSLTDPGLRDDQSESDNVPEASDNYPWTISSVTSQTHQESPSSDASERNEGLKYSDILNRICGDLPEPPLNGPPPVSCELLTAAKTSESKGRKRNHYGDLIESVLNDLQKDEDEFSIVGQNVANKLRKLPAEKVPVVEKLMSDLLFEAQTGDVNRFTRLSFYDVRTSLDGNTVKGQFYSSTQQSCQRTVPSEQDLKTEEGTESSDLMIVP